MVRHTPVTAQSRNLTVTELRQGIERLQKRVAEVKNFDPTSVTDQYNIPHVKALAASVEGALDRTFLVGTTEYNRYKEAATFEAGVYNYYNKVPITSVHASLARNQARSIALLEEAIRSLEEQISEREGEVTLDPVSKPKDPTKIFVVHGHDEAARESVARFIKTLGFEPIILHEKANQGRTIIEKFEAHGNVGFAVVLLTPDDEGSRKGSPPQPRARQNVILELGYFIGRLGRERVCALKSGEIEVPSDIHGVVYERLDSGGAWRQALGKELEAAGFNVDWNKVMKK